MEEFEDDEMKAQLLLHCRLQRIARAHSKKTNVPGSNASRELCVSLYPPNAIKTRLLYRTTTSKPIYMTPFSGSARMLTVSTGLLPLPT
jgi:hypothetical protein